jgi:hypothetical protein
MIDTNPRIQYCVVVEGTFFCHVLALTMIDSTQDTLPLTLRLSKSGETADIGSITALLLL